MRAVVTLLLLLGAARADEPVLHVRARTRLEVQSVVRVPGGVVVRGALFDTALEEPIPGRTVAISVDGPNGFYRYAEPTSEDGSFRWRVPLPLGEYVLRLAAGGDEDYAAAPVLERTLDVGRRSPTLTLQVPETVSAPRDTVDVTVEARDPEGDVDAPLGLGVPADGAEANLPVTLLVGERPVARGRTVGGRLDLELPLHELGKAGDQVTLTARFDGDELRNPAQASRTVRITAPVKLTLAVDPASADADAEVRLSGELRDAGGPVASGLIDLEVVTLAPPGKARGVAQTQTGPDGRFAARVHAGELGFGRLAVEARTRAAGFHEAGRSGPVELMVHSPAFRASPVYLIPPLVTALVLVGLAVARRRPWLAVEARLRARAHRSAPSSGLSEGRTHILRTLRPANDFGVAGLVCDSVTGAPIAGATLVVDVGAQHRSALTDEDGRFALEALPAGTLAVEVAAAGYVSERFHRTVPHRGELRGARVLLVPIRARIFAAYDRAARPLVPKAELTALWTPRELLAHVRGRRLLTDELAALTSAVEAGCYGPAPPDLDTLAEVERLVDEVVERPSS